MTESEWWLIWWKQAIFLDKYGLILMGGVKRRDSMTIRFDSEAGETELLSFDAAIARWPWLKSYRKTLEAKVAIFAEEGQFSVPGESTKFAVLSDH